MKIIKLTAENVKRLKAVEITPDGTVQVITGRNAQGKTSVLDAIWLALGGGAAARETSRPIRDGEETATVTLDLGDLIVTRTWTGAKTALTVKSADGAKYSSPQGVLDALVGRLSFDPLEFTRLSAREQLAALLALVDLNVDLDQVAAERQTLYDERTDVGRDGKQIDGHRAGLGEKEEAPDSEVSATALLDQLRAADALARRQEDEVSRCGKFRASISDLEEELVRYRESLAGAEADVRNHQPVPNIKALEEQLDDVERTNAAVRRNAERATVDGLLTAKRDRYASLTEGIAALDKERSDALAAAKFPVDGLGFTDAGVTYNGVPFSQASAAEQIRVSLAMAMSLNPKLRVIRILDGSLLDDDNLRLITEMAATQDYQVWIERVADQSGVGVVIEDGAVA